MATSNIELRILNLRNKIKIAENRKNELILTKEKIDIINEFFTEEYDAKKLEINTNYDAGVQKRQQGIQSTKTQIEKLQNSLKNKEWDLELFELKRQGHLERLDVKRKLAVQNKCDTEQRACQRFLPGVETKIANLNLQLDELLKIAETENVA